MRASDTSNPGDLPLAAAAVFSQLRERRPRVHCITNSVAQAFTANVLLAAGCIPSMTISPLEISDFAGRADALLVNLGTFDAERQSAIGIALDRACSQQCPWVLDPVLIDVSAARAAYARGLVGRKPAAIRLNAAEFEALAGHNAVRDALSRFAEKHGTVVGMTGASDVVADGRRSVAISNGHEFMGLVTAMGCAASALVAACLAVERDAMLAVTSALLAFAIAGEIAGEEARGPGSFVPAFIDALHGLDAKTIKGRAKIS